MKSITSRFVMLIATAAVAPLVIYGVVSVRQLRSGTEESVTKGNLGDRHAGGRADQSVRREQPAGPAVASRWSSAPPASNHGSSPASSKTRSSTFRSSASSPSSTRRASSLGTSRFGQPTVTIPDRAKAAGRDVYVAPLKQDNDGLPTTTIAVRMGRATAESGWVVGELALEELWRMVDQIKVGEHGRAALFSESGRLIAHGNADKKRLVAVAKGDSRIEQTAARDPGEARRLQDTYDDEIGRGELAVGAMIPSLDWMVDGRAAHVRGLRCRATRLERQLLAVIGAALLGTIIVGSLWGRSFLTAHLRAARARRWRLPKAVSTSASP